MRRFSDGLQTESKQPKTFATNVMIAAWNRDHYKRECLNTLGGGLLAINSPPCLPTGACYVTFRGQ